MRILIAVDDSPHSERAVAFVEGLRWPAGSCALVATALPSAPPPAEAGGEPQIPASTRWARAETLVRDVQARLRSVGMSADHRLLDGDPRDVLPGLVEAERVNLLVMGSRGRTGLMHLMLGSVSAHAVIHAGCSVLVVKTRTEDASHGPSNQKEDAMKILLGIDDSAHSRAAVDLVRRMLWPKGTHVEVVSVVPPVMPVYSEIYVSAESLTGLQEELVREHEGIVASAQQVLREVGLETSVRVLNGDARVALVERAQQDHADMVVVGSHGRTGVAKLFMGSVAHHVVTHAPCSVLVVKVQK